MTVPPANDPWLIFLLVFALVLAVYFFSRLIRVKHDKAMLKTLLASNLRYTNDTLKFCYEEICSRAMLRHIDLPKPNNALYECVQRVFLDNPELNAYEFPLVAVSEMGDNAITQPIYYWRTNDQPGWQPMLPAAVLAHLWLNKVI